MFCADCVRFIPFPALHSSWIWRWGISAPINTVISDKLIDGISILWRCWYLFWSFWVLQLVWGIDKFGIGHALVIFIFCGWPFDEIAKFTNFNSIWTECKNVFCIFRGFCSPLSCKILAILLSDKSRICYYFVRIPLLISSGQLLLFLFHEVICCDVFYNHLLYR